MEALKPNEGRAKFAIIFIWIVMAMEIISLISDYFQYTLLQSAANGETLEMDVATANDTRQRVIAVLHLIFFVISGITFIQWFRRAYYNLHLKTDTLTHHEGWAAGSWFTPIVNFYLPYQIMKELYVETRKLFIPKWGDETQNLSTTLVGWWWALWIISSVLGQIVFQVTMRGDNTIDTLSFTTMTSMIESIVDIPLAIITFKVIKDYSRAELLLFDLHDENPEDPNHPELIIHYAEEIKTENQEEV